MAIFPTEGLSYARQRRAARKRLFQRSLRTETLEDRRVLDAAPYIVEFASFGTLFAAATDYGDTDLGDPDVTISETKEFAGEFNLVPIATPGVRNELLLEIEDSLGLNVGYPAYAFAEVFSGHAEQTDYLHTGTIGQPDSAYFEFETNIGASASAELYNEEIEVSGEAEANIVYQTSFVTQIWDTDCPHAGIPISGEWALWAGARDEQPDATPPTSNFDETVTVKFWRYPEDGSTLLLDSEHTYTVPVGQSDFAEINILETFDLTTGSEIEVVVTGKNSSKTNTAEAVQTDMWDTLYGQSRSYVAARVSDVRYNSIDILDFQHRRLPSGGVDPQWIAVEYEIRQENICYFDLELGSLASGQSSPTTFDSIRISEDILNNSARFMIADANTGALVPNSEAFTTGRHVLLIDGNMPSLQSDFANLDTEIIKVYEPGRQEHGKSFHGFFQSTPASTLIIRSDAETQDSIQLENFSASFDFGGEVSNFEFPLATEVPPITSVPDVIVITAGGDDDVLADPEFSIPIKARLGDGNDIFVGGAAIDEARGGDGNDVLLGEGWLGDVSTLKSLFEDMLDLQFTFSAGLQPAGGSDDSLFGDSGDDLLLGGAGDDTLDGGSGAAVIVGDSLSVDAAITFDIENLEFATDIDFVRSGNGADTITAGNNHTLVIGGGGDDTIVGNTAGTSLLFGNAGNDTITGRNSFAVIAGGLGDDTIDGTGFLIGDSFSFTTFGSSVFDSLANGSLSAGVALTAEDSGADTIQGGNGFDFIVGGDGDDEINGGDGLNIVFGDAFNLSLSIGLSFEKIFRFESAFSIFSAPLAILKLFEFEFKFAGTGNDIYNGGSDTDVVFGGGGDDTLRGNAGFDFLVGGKGNDDVEAGDDSLISGEFFGVAFGGPGDDTITGSSGADYLESEEGNDLFYGLEGDDIIFGGPDADTLDGGPGNDRLYGEGGDDEIIGGDGDDQIFGGDGIDFLDGGPGSNTVNQDPVAPRVIAIGPAPGAENPANATSVEFIVVFDVSVSGVEPADFVIVPTGSATGAIASVSATTGQIVTVTVNAVTGVGNLRLDFDTDASGGVYDNLANVSTEDFTGGYYAVNSPIEGNQSPIVTSPISITASEDDAQFVVDLLDGSSDPNPDDVIFISNLLKTTGNAGGISAGTNSLTIDPSAYNQLRSGQHELIHYSFDIQDGHGGSASQTATINIFGANDPALISGIRTGSLDEDALLPVTGLLNVVDPDEGEDSIVPQVATEGIYGTFWMTLSGAWTYQLQDSAVQFLNSGDSVIDHFPVQSFDGTAQDEIVITILGNDDANSSDQRILFIASDPQPSGYESDVINFLTNLGYVVTTLDDNLVSPNSAVGFDLVYISESVSSGRIGTKLTNSSVPIISSESYLFDDLGLTGPALQTDYGNVHGNSLEVTDATHPILAGLAGSLITIYVAHDNIGWGVPGNGADVIATVPSDRSRAAIIAYAQGATLANGLAAPAARMALPIWNAPTADLLVILENAVEWALGTVAEPVEPRTVILTESDGDTRVTEGATTDTYSIRLSHSPTAPVSISIQANGQISVNPNSVTFDSTNWNAPQTVTVTAVDDSAVEGDHVSIVTHQVATTAAEFATATVDDVVVQITDNDVPIPPVADPKILFIASDPQPSGYESDVISFLTNRGYVVTTLDDNLVSPNSAVGFDLVYISESVSSGRIGTKLTNSSVPIISSESYLFDDLGLTGSALQTDYGNVHGNSLEVTDATHPILTGLAGSFITIYAANDNIGWGVPGNGADVIATVPSDRSRAAIIAYAQGATLANGLAAPAARMALPIWNAPTADLLVILENAVEWALITPSTAVMAEPLPFDAGMLPIAMERGTVRTSTKALGAGEAAAVDRIFAMKTRR